MIDHNTIINSIPYPIRSFFEIESMEFEDNEQYQTAIKAFITAVDIINSHCHINKKVALFFGARQMQIDIDGIPFSYYIPQPALHLHIRNFIYLNVVESSTLSYESQVGAYLEELVHAFMNARNEELTHKIVELLYPCVKHSAEYGFVKR
ncbi:hypothetical protein Q7472_11030 [Glaesserella parasuis]|uniref:hypothetical protein n=1 Tax=Glaesserella parasuis TaxID=738 RepID=UPI001321B3D9|nr:hypothetical protein [Glaesserella parasuis]MCT8829425.1 hypothetical protein [Glaesserella parasuis]MCT8833666.1 hypothetical protein [Glaesserella parasuis]MDG6236331.1 hypothetical protein [Glaesserella parasuis]MDG6355972.1 hypothetical protein [Glaesserella parasuis]MDO9674949.1 hypothetical protein [Glaesserella parasuis]